MPANKTTRQIKLLQQRLSKLPSDFKKVLIDAEQEFVDQLKTTHRQGQDPYGQTWKPRKKSYPHPILNKTGKLVSSYSAKATKRGLKLENSAPYSGFHDKGTVHLPIRQLLPKGQLPKEFKLIIERKLARMINERY